MSETINPGTFVHLVALAALDMSADEADYLRNELNKQLDSIRELEAIPLQADTPLTTHGVPYTSQTSQPLRLDEWQPFENPQDILAQVPHLDEGYIKVPTIPHTDLK